MSNRQVWFIDSSALVKRYIAETGSPFVRRLFLKGKRSHVFIVSALTYVELIAAFARRKPVQPQSVVQQFVLEWPGMTRIPIDHDILARGAELAQLHRLRAADAIQLASALRVSADFPNLRLLTADAEMILAGQTESLVVENPNFLA